MSKTKYECLECGNRYVIDDESDEDAECDVCGCEDYIIL